MFAVLALALLQASEPAAAVGAPAQGQAAAQCRLDAHGRAIERLGPDRLSAVCPDDVEGAARLQAAADAALAAVDLDLRGDRELSFRVADRIVFERSGEDWAPMLGQIIVEREFNVPTLSRSPANWMVCSPALEPDSSGTPVAPQTYCLSDGDDARLTSRMQAALVSAIENTRFLPAPVSYCMNRQYVGRVEIHHPFSGERWEGGGDRPDPARLPDLCAGS